jgi:phosphate/sulfate permease
MAFSHGSNDGQKFMGAFSLALFLGNATDSFTMARPATTVNFVPKT